MNQRIPPRPILPPRRPSTPATPLARAAQCFQQGDAAQAARLCEEIVRKEPADARAWQLLGMARIVGEQFAPATEALQQALALDGRNAQTLCLLGTAYSRLGRGDEAIACFDRALAIDVRQAPVWYDRGNVLHTLGRHAQALESLERALMLAPNFANAWLNRGHVLAHLKQSKEAQASYKEALASYRKAVEADPKSPTAWFALGKALTQVHRLPDALTCYEKAVALDDRNAEAWISYGATLLNLGGIDDALEAFDKAETLNPNAPSLWSHRAMALHKQGGRATEAVAALQKAHALAPHSVSITMELMHMLQNAADWQPLPPLLDAVRDLIRAGEAASPFAMLAHPGLTADDLLKASVRAATQPDDEAVLPTRLDTPATPVGQRRLRIGYLSSDLHQHPVGRLMAGAFGAHDKSRFEIFAFSTNPLHKDQSPLGQRIHGAFDHFIDLHTGGDAQAADLIAWHKIDILVDLNGPTANARPGITARRPAPIQVAYLGHPGTTGMGQMDYILGDRWVTPPGAAAEFSEHIVRLPECFQANDNLREPVGEPPPRAELKLPEQGFVFCCFNNTYKLNAPMFDIWMRVLRQIPGSVLWLVAAEPQAEDNLRAEARARGVDGARLVFAPRAGYDLYMARYRQADLFLDTLPFNAGTTASDALWAGLPVLTQLGHSFAGRMAASLLDAVGLPELIARSAEEYEATALRLATEPGLLAALRERLAANLQTTPLFDTRRFTRHLERAYEMVWTRHVQGLPPAELDVPALDTAVPLSAAAAST
ncbi:tetratricopeptide repeat protein [Ottowia sp.]|uniref:O-linked N-acetylglucosamine transferase, SPINDLY family protein n=1 Tax=Ottowia sp. TaxID=1898956 RepID=UPI0039E3880C